MADHRWNGGVGSYLDPAQWTPAGVPLYGASETATIDAGMVTLSSAEPNGITLVLGGATNPELLLSNAAFGPATTIDTTSLATLGVQGYDTNYGRITLGGKLTVDAGGYGQFNQLGTITVPAGSSLTVGQAGVLNNDGLIDFTGGSGTIADSIAGSGTIALDAVGSALEVTGAVGPGVTFALRQGSLRFGDASALTRFNQPIGTLSDFGSAGASLTLGNFAFTRAAYATTANGALLALSQGDQTVAAIPLANTDPTFYAVTANADGTSTVTPVAPTLPRIFSDGSIPGTITSGSVTIRNAEPNGQDVQIGASAPALAPELILANAALGPQLRFNFIGPGGISFPSYATIRVQGYDTLNTTLGLGGRPVSPQILTIKLDPYGQLNQEGTISVKDGSVLTVKSEDAGAPGVLNNDGSILVSNGTATILSDVTGSGSFTLRASITGSSDRLEFAGAVAPGQTVLLNAGTLLLDKPLEFMGILGGFANNGPDYPALILMGLQADSALFQPDSGGGGELLLTNKGALVDSIGINGSAEPGGYVVAYTPATNSTMVSVSSGIHSF